jgi:hypothetical protein
VVRADRLDESGDQLMVGRTADRNRPVVCACALTQVTVDRPRAAVVAEIFWTGAKLPNGQARNVVEALPRLHELR